MDGYFAFLAETGRVFAESAEADPALNTAARLAVPRLADWCLIQLTDRYRNVLSATAARLDPEGEDGVRVWHTGYPPGQGAAPAYHPALEGLPEGPSEVLPLSGRGQLLGILALGMAGPGGFSEEQSQLAREFARCVVLGLENIRLRREAEDEAVRKVMWPQGKAGEIAPGEVDPLLRTLVKANEEARRNRDLLQTTLDTLHGPVLVVEASGRPLFMNRAYARFLGYASVAAAMAQPAEVQGGRCKVFDATGRPVPPDQWPLAKALAGQSPPAEPLRCRNTVTGEETWFEIRAVPQLDADGTVRLVILSGHDITDRRQAEEASRRIQEREQQDRKMDAIGRLAGGMSHDFNNLLMAINGFADLILASDHDFGEMRGYVAQIRKSGERAASLTRQLLAYSRRQLLLPEVTDLNEVVRSLSGPIEKLVDRGTVLARVPDSGLAKVLVDPGQMKQVILNLVKNSRDAMPKGGGRITLSTFPVDLPTGGESVDAEIPPGRYAVLEVADTGQGMDPLVVERIFDPFFTTKPLGVKTGLGLAMVQGIVRQSGGFIQVSSQKSVGTAFRIYLPAVDAARETLSRATA